MKKIGNRKSEIGTVAGFTLIELLVVIAVIGVLAAFVLSVLGGVKRRQYLTQTQAELAQLETAIDSYKAAYGFYPPGNPKSPIFTPLYYELLGTTLTPANGGTFQTLDGSASITVTDVSGPLGVGGFVNCTKGAGEDAAAAKNFLPDLKPNRYGVNFISSGVNVALLLAAAGGPDQNYKPVGVAGANPWRYACPGTNNPSSYDLWVQLVISGKTNLVCNWNKQVQINSPLP